MKVRPLGDKVLIKRTDSQEKTEGGIIIPDTASEKPQEGKVVAVGPGKTSESGKSIKLDVKKGEKVLFGKFAGTEIKLDGEDYIIVEENEIVAVIEK